MLKPYLIIAFLSTNLVIFPNAFATISDFDNAKISLKEQEFSTATIHLKNHLQKQPDDAKARFLLGDIYLYAGELEASIKELSRAHTLDPNNQEYLFKYAESLLRASKYQTLIDLFNQSQDDAKKLAYLGYAHLGLNKTEFAKELFNRSNKIKNNAMALNGLATLSLNTQQLPVSNELLNRALKIEPDNIRSLTLKAKFLILNHQPNDALNVFNQLIQKNSSDIAAFIGRGTVNSLLGNQDNAINDLNKALSKAPKHPEANLLLSQIFFQKSDFNSSRIHAQKVLDIIPGDPAALLIIGKSQLRLNNLFQADKHLAKYLASNPNDVNTINMLARYHFNNQNPKKAISIIEKTEPSLRNQSTKLLLTLSDSYFVLGNRPKGISTLQKAKALAPNNPDVKKSLVAALLRAGQAQSVISELESIIQAGSAQPLDQYLLITAYINQNNLNLAKQRLQQFMRGSPNDLALKNLDALISQLEGDYETAHQKYDQVLRLDKNNSAAQKGFSRYYVTKTQSFLRKQDYNGALSFVKKIPNTKNNQNIITILQADIFRAQNKFSEALPLYRKAFDDSQNPVVLNTLIDTMRKLYKTKEAVKLMESVSKKDPQNIELLMMLAQLYQSTSQTQKLQNTYQDILILRPYNTAILNNLAWLVYKKDLNKALSMTEKAYNHAPNSAAIKDSYGYFLVLKGNHEVGLNILKEAEQLDPTDKNIQFHIAFALNKLGKKSSAKKILNDITKGNSNFAELENARLLLKNIL